MGGSCQLCRFRNRFLFSCHFLPFYTTSNHTRFHQRTGIARTSLVKNRAGRPGLPLLGGCAHLRTRTIARISPEPRQLVGKAGKRSGIRKSNEAGSGPWVHGRLGENEIQDSFLSYLPVACVLTAHLPANSKKRQDLYLRRARTFALAGAGEEPAPDRAIAVCLPRRKPNCQRTNNRINSILS